MKGKIYKLTNTKDYDIYVGSTRGRLVSRLLEHASTASVHPERTVYKHLNNIGWEKVDIQLLEVYTCQTVKELRIREQWWIDQLGALLNCNKAYCKPCPHGRQVHLCKDCGGSQICPHDKQKASCVRCKGKSICIHKRQRATCKICKGSRICPCGRQKATCKDAMELCVTCAITRIVNAVMRNTC